MIIQRISLEKRSSWNTKKEAHKFLLIFHTLVETINSQEAREEADGFVTDTILQIVNIIPGLLKNNIDSINILAVLKSALKKLKGLFIPQTKNTEEGKKGEPEPENAELSNNTEEANEASGDGIKNNDRIRVRNRRYKIKRFILQPRNIDVRHNGRVVKRMVVRRQTIYQPLDVGESIKSHVNSSIKILLESSKAVPSSRFTGS